MTIQFAHDYEPVRCSRDDCDQRFAMSAEFYAETRRTGMTWYCPRGHARAWTGQSTEQKLREAEAQLTHTKDQLIAAAVEAETVRSQMLRDRQRFANGVCPCCNRSFTNVMRHMKTKHPDYDPTHIGSTIEFRCSCGRTFATSHGLKIHQGRSRSDGWAEPDAPRWRAHLTKV